MTFPTQPWTLADAVDLCRKVEAVCPEFNCHVALTGGTLYKDGERKDCDIVFYRIRGKEIDYDGLTAALLRIGLVFTRDFGWGRKAIFGTRSVDVFFPEKISTADELEYAG